VGMGADKEWAVYLTRELEISLVVTATSEDEAAEKAAELADNQVWINISASSELEMSDDTTGDWEVSHTEEA